MDISPAEYCEIINCFNHLLSYRKPAEYLRHQSKAVIKDDDIFAVQKFLPANYANCSLMMGETVIMNSLFATSVKGAEKVRDIQMLSDRHGYTLPTTVASLALRQSRANQEWYSQSDPIWVASPYPASTFALYEIEYKGEYDRVHDSERILLNVIHSLIVNKDFIFDRVILLTERIPCVSCTKVIIDFLTQHDVKLILAYCYSSGRAWSGRGYESFSEQLKTAPDILGRLSVKHIIELRGGVIDVIDRTVN